MSRKHGEYISLDWDADHPEFHAAKGHLNHAEFEAARTAYDGEPHPLDVIEHVYGRYEFSGQDDYGNGARSLTPYLYPGPGRFPMTVTWRDDGARRRCLSLKPGKVPVAQD